MPSETAPTLAATIRARGRITGEDVRALRRAIWREGAGVDRAWAETILRLHRDVAARDPAWAELFREALLEFFFYGRDDGVVDEAGADMLLRGIGADAMVEDAAALRLLLDLVFRARRCPPRLVTFARDALLRSITSGRGSPGIDASEVEAIRRLVYGSGGAEGLQVGEAEALWLAALDRATAAAGHVPAWRDLFVRALAMYLLLGRGTGERLDLGGVQWIREHLDGGQGLTANGRALVAYLRREARAVDPALTGLAA